MLVKLSVLRLKAEWWKMLLLLGFAVFYFWTIISQIPPVNFDNFMRQYGTLNPESVATALDVADGQSGMDMYEVFERYISNHRDFFYTKPIDNSVMSVILMGEFLAVLLICSLFSNRTVSVLLQGGCRRRSVFVSITGTFYLLAIAIWLIVTSLVRVNYCITFSADEQSYFLTTYISWLLMVLATVSIPYAAAFMFHHALPTVLVSFLVSLVLLFTVPRSFFPTGVMTQNTMWRPDADMSALINADIVSLCMIVLAVAVSGMCFARRGQK